MIKLDPIIAVGDVESSANWYKQVFGFVNAHGGSDFAVLKSDSGAVILCLHQWGTHEHPTLTEQNEKAGNGLLLYLRVGNIQAIKDNLDRIEWSLEEETHLNENSRRNEFSIRDPDGYFLTVSEFHEYQG